jgi:3-isopropylmalate dehydratase small subunit
MKLVLGLAVVAVLVYGCWLMIPPFFANYQFEDAIKNTSLNSTYTARSEDDIRNVVLKSAKDLDIALTKEQIKVQRTGTNGTGSLLIDVDYSVHVDLPGYPIDLHFHPSTANKGIY